MGFLQQLLSYKSICIQCHNSPDSDTLASAFGLYCYFNEHGIAAEIIYSGEMLIKKHNLRLLIDKCKIPIRHVDALPQTELLLIADGQYGAGNVTRFEAPAIAVVDHHIRSMEERPHVLIKSDYQSCSTIVWELLEQEGYDVKGNEALRIALLYGLFIDTSSFYDLYRENDMKMRTALSGELPLFEKLTKSTMTVAELMIASDAMQEHYFDPQKRFAIVSAMRCDQAILGIIGDFMIQVDVISVSFCYTEVDNGYQISVRSCDNQISANLLVAFVCDGIGSGGGHNKKAGGRISAERLTAKYGSIDLFEFVKQKLSDFIEIKETQSPLR
ncbi:MAG: DHH family phosphoesterase [Hydrogenoanaerobacterium sp.]